MNHDPARMSRRQFAAAVAAAPLALPRQAAVPDPPPGKRPVTGEEPPFAGALEFARRDADVRLHPYALSEVTLLPGPCRDASEHNRAYMMRLAPDRLLHNFRSNAGLPSQARPLGGWEAPSSELRGHFVGHYLSACALRYASAGDAELKARGDELVAELARCQSKLDGGYLSAFPVGFFERLDRRAGVWAPFYTVHKIMAGLVDMHRHAGNRQALDVAAGMAAWTDAWTAAKSDAHMQDILRVEYGGMNEALYDLAAATGDDRWGRAGDRFNKKAFLAPLVQRRDELVNLHANTHIPQVIGAARRFELSQDPRFRDAAEFFWHTVATARTYATGGSSNAEAWLTNPGHLSLEWKAGTHHQECCCAYNMMKLTRRLYSWSGDPRYVDYYERNLFNHRLGAIAPDTGHSVYFLSLAPGAWKTQNTEDTAFWCCTGSALEEYSKLNDSIYYRDGSGVTVNLFVASELRAREQGVTLRQQTGFPQEAGTRLTIVDTPGAPWTLRLRIPEWTSSASVKLNGRALDGTPGARSYFSLTRAWKAGDRVELSLPMRLVAEPLPDNASVQAFLYGPIVLAGDLGTDGLTEDLIHQQGPETGKAPIPVPVLRRTGRRLEDWIAADASSPLAFRVSASTGSLRLRPLSELWGRFAVYWSLV